LPPWLRLLERTIDALTRLRSAGQSIPDWVLGGGTALMLHAQHRISKDIDAFITDPQYLALLSPRLAGEDAWNCDTYQESANHLRLVFEEGEIDIIVAPPVTNLSNESRTFDVDRAGRKVSFTVAVEHPVEIALKKLRYRGASLKVRDIFDIAVIDKMHPDILRANLRHISDCKSDILERLGKIPESFLRRELAELSIVDMWREGADECLVRVQDIIKAAPQ
jgi:hypothetical protein